jgi:hypothetical protein
MGQSIKKWYSSSIFKDQNDQTIDNRVDELKEW